MTKPYRLPELDLTDPDLKIWLMNKICAASFDKDGCLIPYEWDNGGYVRWIKKDKDRNRVIQVAAHRASYTLLKMGGYLPRGVQVFHKCRNTCCIHPEHLSLETKESPIHNKGGVITQETIDLVRRLRAAGITREAVHQRTGIGKRILTDIVKRNGRFANV